MHSKHAAAKVRIFYGWYIVAAGFLILFCMSGARFSFGVAFKPMIAEFGWDRSSISLAYLLNMLVFALTLSISGVFYDRYGPRWVMVIATVALAVGYLGIAAMGALWQFMIFYGVLSAVGFGGASLPLIAALTSKWFDRRRGFAISLAIAGNCLGQFALVPLFAVFLLRYGWRASYAATGMIVLAVNTILVLGVIKPSPHALGQQPWGAQPAGAAGLAQASRAAPARRPDLKLHEAMRTASFWFFLTVMFVCGSGDFLVTTHLIPLVTDYGIAPSTAASMLAWFGMASLAGILIAGPVADRIGNKIPIAVTFGLRFLLYVMILRYRNFFTFYVFAATFGFTFLITAPLTTTLVGKLFGFRHVGLISGFITTIHHLGGGLGAYLGGLIFDHTKSYQLAFVFSAGLALLAVASSLFIKERRHCV
ncbi:MAG: MFS transporter [Desulfobacterales bacterium]|nr:MAG: MFS transporter [Desulfobacterales bacterium]